MLRISPRGIPKYAWIAWWMVHLVLLSSFHPPHNRRSVLFPVVVVVVEAQHPIVKFLQMHTTHRHHKNDKNNKNSNKIGNGDFIKEGGNDKEEEEPCRSIQERLEVVEAQRVQLESSRQELLLQVEQLQLAQDTRQEEHDESVRLLKKEFDQLLQESTRECQKRRDSEKEEFQRQQDMMTETKQHHQQLQQQLQHVQTQKSTCDGEMHALQTQLERTQVKYERILKEYDVALQTYVQENFDAVVQNQTEIAVRNVQDEYDAFQIDCGKSIHQLQEVIRNTTIELNQTTVTCANNITQLQEDMQQQKKIMEEDYLMQQQEWRYVLLQTEHSHDEKMVELRQSLHSQCNATLESLLMNHTNAIMEYDVTMNQMTVRYQDSIQSLLTEHNQTKTNYESNIQNLTLHYNTVVVEWEAKYQSISEQVQLLQQQLLDRQQAYSQLQAQYQQTLTSSQYWESKFQQRSYLNVTYIVSDVHVYLTQQLPFRLQHEYVQPYILQPCRRMYTNVQQEMIPSVVQSINETYQQRILLPYLKPMYEQYYTVYVLPHLSMLQQLYMKYCHAHTSKVISSVSAYSQTYLSPRILQVRHYFLHVYYNIVVHEIVTFYDESMDHYRTMVCPQLQQSLTRPKSSSSTTSRSSSTTTTPNQNINVAVQVVQYTCDHTHETIVLLIKIVLGTLLLIYHQSILRLVWVIGCTILMGVVYHYNPVRLLYRWLFGRRRHRPSMAVTMNGNHSAASEEDLYILEPHDNNHHQISTMTNQK